MRTLHLPPGGPSLHMGTKPSPGASHEGLVGVRKLRLSGEFLAPPTNLTALVFYPMVLGSLVLWEGAHSLRFQ